LEEDSSFSSRRRRLWSRRRASDSEKTRLGRTVGVINPDAKNEKHVRRMYDLYASGKSLYFIGSFS
jgi:hypothetical protein